MDEPRLAHRNEFDEIMRFTDKIFRPNRKGRYIVAGNYPNLYNPSNHKRILLQRDRGQLVGCLGIHPIVHIMEEVKLNAGGIGIVGTHPKRRGEGIMTTLLNNAIARMRETGCSISVLGGDRQRYNWFGWEMGGLRHVFTLNLRHLGKPSLLERRLPLRQLQSNKSSSCRNILYAGSKRPYWVERTLRDIQPLFVRSSRHTWVCEYNGRFAYICLKGANHFPKPYNQIDEAGGDRELVLSMLRVLMSRHRVATLKATTGPNPDEINQFRFCCSDWQSSSDQSIKILDLPTLTRELRPILSRRARATGVNNTFHFEMTTTGQASEIRLGNGRQYNVRLSDCDMTTLFFGNIPFSSGICREVGQETSFSQAAQKALEKILPITLYNPPVTHC